MPLMLEMLTSKSQPIVGVSIEDVKIEEPTPSVQFTSTRILINRGKASPLAKVIFIVVVIANCTRAAIGVLHISVDTIHGVIVLVQILSNPKTITRIGNLIPILGMKRASAHINERFHPRGAIHAIKKTLGKSLASGKIVLVPLIFPI